MSTLKIYSASAGSGKTYTLAGEFINLLINDPSNYSSILAVTFTNKATAEMKTRIIENLYLLASDDEKLNDTTRKKRDELVKYHTNNTGKSEKMIKSACRIALHSYLNDFSKFNISTIDSFFQKIIRSFAYEAGLPASFNIEVDQDIILQQSIDRIFMEIGTSDHDDLKKWILDFTNSRMRDGSGWAIEKSLTNLGKEVFKESLQSMGHDYKDKLLNKTELRKYQQILDSIINDYEDKLKTLTQSISELFQSLNIKTDELAGKSRSPLIISFSNPTRFTEWRELRRITALDGIISDPESACQNKLKEHQKSEIISKLNQGVLDMVEKFTSHIKENFRNYFTAKSIHHNFYSLGITIDIRNKIAELAREENIFLISDTNRLLNEIIDNNDAPFIYEKSGTRYKNIMIDEFQDTSRLQWNNFRPLIMNSLSQNDDCLIVGDVKQSIYRWRNSDWQLLNQTVYDDMQHYTVNRQSLQNNWRSSPNIINFNNTVFEKASQLLRDQINTEISEAIDKLDDNIDLPNQITKAYSDTVQVVPQRNFKHDGYIKVQFIEKEADEDNQINDVEPEDEAVAPVMTELENSINQLLANNFKHSDICILVRGNREGSKVASHLLSLKKPIPVISNDSLLLGNSSAIKLLIACLRFINDPADKVSLAHIKLMFSIFANEETAAPQQIMTDFLNSWQSNNNIQKEILKHRGLPFYELAEKIVSMIPSWVIENQSVFISGFMENVRSFTTNKTVNVNDFLQWWDEKGATTAISVPENQEAVRIMTIHKSKGLQFKAVLLPFANWEIDKKPGQQSIIWSSPTAAPFSDITPIPVAYTEVLAFTHMCKDYYHEMLYRYVDNLNLLYVALTRAEDVLMVWCEKEKEKEKISSITTLMSMILPSVTGDKLTDIERSDDNMIFEAGSIPILEPVMSSDEDKSSNVTTRYFRNKNLQDKVKIHLESENISHITGNIKVWQGNLMHRIMEQIKTKDDVEAVIQGFMESGMITDDEHTELLKLISDKIAQVPHWFDGSHTIYCETPILTADKKTYRPDRIMVKDGKATVVDYKFGELKSEDYKTQVVNYQKLIKQMGFGETESYIWYFNDDKGLTRIDNQPKQGSLF